METKEAKCSDVKDEKLSSESKQQNCEHEFLVLKMLFGGLEEKTDKMNEEISLQHLMIDQFRKGIRREMQEKTSEIIRASTAALESRLDILEKENNILREELQKARNFESKKSSSILQPQKKSLLSVPCHIVGPQPAAQMAETVQMDPETTSIGTTLATTSLKKRSITKPKRFWEQTEDGSSKTKREKK